MSRIQELREQHGQPSERSQAKITNYLSDVVCEFIQQAPFAVLATSNANGDCDASPRGGKPGFVKIIDNKTLLMPDVRGNRLLQSTENMISNPKAGLLFFIPGNNSTVRVNGSVRLIETAEIEALNINNEVFNADETSHVIQGYLITVDEAYKHCPRALSFSNLWAKEE